MHLFSVPEWYDGLDKVVLFMYLFYHEIWILEIMYGVLMDERWLTLDKVVLFIYPFYHQTWILEIM